MKILLVGASGRLGTAVGRVLTGRGHHLLTVGHTAGDIRADVADPEQTARVFAEVSNLAVSPTVFIESMAEYGDLFPGVTPVGVDVAAAAYVRSIEGAETGQAFLVQ
jgi:uncharacterized protein YbjT (DUF2867 family)